MINIKTEELLNKIIDKTLVSKIKWKKLEDIGYKTNLPSGTIRVIKYPSGSYGLRIFNEKGDLIDSHKLNITDSDQDYFLLDRLYTAIQKTYLVDNKTIDALIKDIDA